MISISQVKVWKSPICWRAHRTSWTWRRGAVSSGGATLLTTLRLASTIQNYIFIFWKKCSWRQNVFLLPGNWIVSNLCPNLKWYWTRGLSSRDMCWKSIFVREAGFHRPADSFISQFQHKMHLLATFTAQTNFKKVWTDYVHLKSAAHSSLLFSPLDIHSSADTVS